MDILLTKTVIRSPLFLAGAGSTFKVWMTLALLSDHHGYVCASIGTLANFAYIPADKCVAALEWLSTCQPYDKKPHIVEAPGGWIVDLECPELWQGMKARLARAEYHRQYNKNNRDRKPAQRAGT